MKKVFYLFGIFLVFVVRVFSQIPATATEKAFADWDYSPTQVYGIKSLTSTEQRYHVKLVKVSPTIVKVQRFSANGQPSDTSLVVFAAGFLKQITFTNRWGYTYGVARFSKGGPGELVVTRFSSGINSYLPAKAVRDIYKKGLLVESRYVSFEGKPIANSDGVAIFRYSRYVNGNRYSKLKEISYFDESDKPVISRGQDCHKIAYEYDANGNLVTTTYLGNDDAPLTNRFGGYRIRNTYDGSDRLLSSTTIGLDDKPVNNAYGVAATVWEYKNGLTARSTRYDALGNITRTSSAGDGIAVITYEYDPSGYLSLSSYFDERNLPMNAAAGYGRVAYKYSPIGMLLSTAYFDKAGTPSTDRDGIHRYEYVRDDKGRSIQEAYFDKAGVPMKDTSDQVFIERTRYDEDGRRAAVSYWQLPDAKMARWNGTHEIVYKYDQNGQIVEGITYDTNGKLFVSESGYSRFVNKFDAAARWIERSYFNGADPVLVSSGFAKGFHSIKYTYDEKGRVAELRYFDKGNQPVNAEISFDEKLLFHKIEFVYKGNRIMEQKLYAVNTTVAGRIIDCIKSNYVNTNGISIGRKN